MSRPLCLLLLFATLTISIGKAQTSVLDVGVRLQQTINLYSENGAAVSYSSKSLYPDRLYFGLSYVSSRLGSAYHSNAIKQDNFLASAAWYFRREHIIRPFARLNAGYFTADYGDRMFNILPRSSVLLSTDAGISFNTNTPLKISTSLGYNFITGNGLSGPGTLYPVFCQVSFTWSLHQSFKIKRYEHPGKGEKLKL